MDDSRGAIAAWVPRSGFVSQEFRTNHRIRLTWPLVVLEGVVKDRRFALEACKQEKQAEVEGFEHTSISHGNSDFSLQAARNPARSAMETLLLEFWNTATDSAKFQALELLRLNSATNAK